MATYAATSTSTMATHITSSVAAGDTITLAGGDYAAWTWTTSKTFSPAITIKALDPTNPPKFKTNGSSGWMWNVTNLNGVIFDGIEFIGTDEKDGYGYPGGSGCYFKAGCHNITIKNCWFDFMYRGLSFQSTAKNSNITIQRNTWTRNGMDAMQFYTGVDGLLIEHNWHYNAYIDTAVRLTSDEKDGRHHNTVRHPDVVQMALNGSEAGSNIVIRNNWFEGNYSGDKYMHIMFLYNETVNKGATDAKYFTENFTVQNNMIIGGHTNGIALAGMRGTVLIERNVIRTIPGSPDGSTVKDGLGNWTDYRPRLNLYKGVGTSTEKAVVKNNVWGEPGPSVMATGNDSNVSYSNNTKSETAFPTGWVDFTYGRYSEGTTTTTKPDALESALVTMSGTAYNAGLIEFADGTFQAYSGTVIVQDTSKAWNTDPAKSEFQWRAIDENVNGWKPMRVGTPSKNAANSTRYEMRSDYETAAAATAAGFPGAHRTHARKGGGIEMKDITLRWRPVGTTTWSDESTFSLVYKTPAATAPTVSAVTLNNSAYTVGQTATATLTYAIGSGTFTSLTVQWLLGTTIVATQTLTNGTTTATYVTAATGSLTAKAILATSVNAATSTSTAATVTSTAVLPDVTAVSLDKAAYTVGETATATPTYTAGNGTGLTLTYQWKRAGSNISGATSASYVLQAADIGSATVTCSATATTSAGADTATSSASSVAVAPVPPVVASVALNQSSYTAGQTATATPTYTAGNGSALAVTYQWRRSGTAISGATAASYAIGLADIGTGTLACSVTVTTSAGSSTATSPASSVTQSDTAPTVPTAALTNAAYTVGQTATVNFTISAGSGTVTSLVAEWYLGAALVETDTLAVTATTATYVTAATGSLTSKILVTTSVGSANRTTSAATVTAAPVAPDVSSVILDNTAYAVGQTATVNFTATMGNGIFTSLAVEWRLDGVTVETDSLAATVRTAAYLVAAVGSLTSRVTAITSAGTDFDTSAAVPVTLPGPAALATGDWEVAGVVSASGFTDRFTAQVRMLIADSAITGMDWTTDGTTWRPCISRGLDTQGRKLWELGPSAASGDSAHTVGYDQTSAPIYVRISTAQGTSGMSTGAGKTFSGFTSPPVDEDDLAAPTDADWSLVPIPVGKTGQFTGRVTIQGSIDPEAVKTLQWTVADGVWRPMVKAIGAIWEMQPGNDPEGHLVAYGGNYRSVRIRYTTDTGTSAPSVTTKALVAPATPGGTPGLQLGGIAISGAVVRTIGLVIPGTPSGTILAEVAEDPTKFSFVVPSLPVGATNIYLIYAGNVRLLVPGATWIEPRVAGQGVGMIVAVDAAGTNGRKPGAESVARYFPVP